MNVAWENRREREWSKGKPRAAPMRFPYLNHRTVAEVDRYGTPDAQVRA